MPRALVIINRHSRNGGSDLTAALDSLRAQGIDPILTYPDAPQAIAPLIQRHRREVDRVVIGGGDGTLHAAVQSLVDVGLPLGVLPLGTANDLARTLLLPTDPVEACRVIAEGHCHTIDLGCVNDRYFLNAAGVGLGPEVTRRLSSERKRRWGILSYGLGVLETLRHWNGFRADIVCDGESERKHVLQITVGNGRYYGGGLITDDTATAEDGRLHVCLIRPLRWWQWALVLPALRRGWPHRGLQVRTAQTVTVRTRRPLPVTADGEWSTWTPAEFRVLPRTLPVYVPRDSLTLSEENRRVAQ